MGNSSEARARLLRGTIPSFLVSDFALSASVHSGSVPSSHPCVTSSNRYGMPRHQLAEALRKWKVRINLRTLFHHLLQSVTLCKNQRLAPGLTLRVQELFHLCCGALPGVSATRRSWEVQGYPPLPCRAPYSCQKLFSVPRQPTVRTKPAPVHHSTSSRPQVDRGDG